MDVKLMPEDFDAIVRSGTCPVCRAALTELHRTRVAKANVEMVSYTCPEKHGFVMLEKPRDPH